MDNIKQKRLIYIVKRFLDFSWLLLIFSMIAWSVTILVVGFNIPAEPELRHTDVNLFLSFKTLAENSGAELITGWSNIKLNNTHSLAAWYWAGTIPLLPGIFGLYAVYRARQLFTAMHQGQIFIPENVEHIKAVAYALIALNVCRPILQYFGGRAALADIGQFAQNIQLSPGFEFNITGLFTGIAILVLAGVLKEAARTHQEQALTI